MHWMACWCRCCWAFMLVWSDRHLRLPAYRVVLLGLHARQLDGAPGRRLVGRLVRETTHAGMVLSGALLSVLLVLAASTVGIFALDAPACRLLLKYLPLFHSDLCCVLRNAGSSSSPFFSDPIRTATTPTRVAVFNLLSSGKVSPSPQALLGLFYVNLKVASIFFLLANQFFLWYLCVCSQVWYFVNVNRCNNNFRLTFLWPLYLLLFSVELSILLR